MNFYNKPVVKSIFRREIMKLEVVKLIRKYGTIDREEIANIKKITKLYKELSLSVKSHSRTPVSRVKV